MKMSNFIFNGTINALQIFQEVYKKLANIMKGFCHPDEVFEEKLEHNVRTLMTALKDPTLPLLELQVSNIKLMSV